MASRNGQFLLFDALPFLCTFPLDLLRRRRVGVVDAASCIGANLYYLSALTSIHDNRLGHLVTGFLNGGELSARAVRFLDLQLDIVIPSQGSALAGIPCRRNLDQLRFGFQSFFHGSVDLRAETVGRRALCGISMSTEEWVRIVWKGPWIEQDRLATSWSVWFVDA